MHECCLSEWGTCNNGVCSCVNPYFGTHCDSLLCNLGYEGNLCQTECRNKYSGLFSGSETDSTGTLSYNIRFDSVMNDVTKIKVLNTYNASITINGTFRQNCSINIDTQAIGVGQIYGSVTIIGGKISYQYFLSTGGAYEPHTWVQN